MSSVLIIEDDADVADTIQACIHAAGYTSYLAETGERGLELCQIRRRSQISYRFRLP